MVQYLTVIPLLADEYQAAMVFDRPLAIARMANLNLPGGGIFDTLIAQAVLKANVDLLFTLNSKYFTRLETESFSLVQVPSQTK